MNERDAINICSTAAGIIAGIVAVLIFLAMRRRMELWWRYVQYATPAAFFTMAAAHWLGWYGLMVAVPAGGLVFFAVWMDARKKFPL